MCMDEVEAGASKICMCFGGAVERKRRSIGLVTY